MKTLKEHNEQRNLRINLSEPVPAGVKCDDCDTEMLLESPNIVLASWPGKQTVVCPKCNKRGYKVM